MGTRERACGQGNEHENKGIQYCRVKDISTGAGTYGQGNWGEGIRIKEEEECRSARARNIL